MPDLSLVLIVIVATLLITVARTAVRRWMERRMGASKEEARALWPANRGMTLTQGALVVAGTIIFLLAVLWVADRLDMPLRLAGLVGIFVVVVPIMLVMAWQEGRTPPEQDPAD